MRNNGLVNASSKAATTISKAALLKRAIGRDSPPRNESSIASWLNTRVESQANAGNAQGCGTTAKGIRSRSAQSIT